MVRRSLSVQQLAIYKRLSPSVRERIVRLNPDLKAGQRLRGYFPKPMSWRRVKKRLLRGQRAPWGPFRSPGGTVHHGIMFGPVDLACARRMGWLSQLKKDDR